MPSSEVVPRIERYARWVVRCRIAVLLGVLAATAFLASQLGHVHLEIRRRANWPAHHPYVAVQSRITELFGGEGAVIVGVAAREGTIYTPAILAKLHRITQGLLATRGILAPSVMSLAAPMARAVLLDADGGMELRALDDPPPTSPEDAAAVRALVRAEPLFRDTLVSADETVAVIAADFDDQLTDVAITERLETLLAPERDDTVTFALAGAPVLSVALRRYTASIGMLFPIAVLVIGLVHYEAFRTLQAMLLPLVTALLSVVWALGVMGLLRLPLDTWSAITPIVILAIGAGHAVQILKRYYEEYAVVADTREAVVRALVGVGPVMLTAGLIAAGGFASLMTFGIASVRAFGLLLAAGIVSALVIELTFIPACRSLMPAPARTELARERRRTRLDAVLDHLAGLLERRSGTILATWALVAVVAGAGMAGLAVDNSFRLWFAPSTQVRQDDALLNAKLPGIATLRLLVEGDAPNAVIQPDVLRAVRDLQAFLERDPQVGGTVSIADHVARIHRAMQGGQPPEAIPDNPRLIYQYLFLYGLSAGPTGLGAFVDPDYRATVIRSLSKTDSAVFSRDVIHRTQAFVDERFAGLPVHVGVAGGTLGVQTAMNDTVVREKLLNMLQVSALIFGLSALVLRSLTGGLLVLVPLLVSVAIALGAMGWTGTWLDMTTAAFTAMAMSIGADFAVYLIFRIREERRRHATLPDAVATALRTSGKAIFSVSSAVTLGYLVLLLAGFSLWTRLALVTSGMIFTSALASLTLLPALILRLEPRFLRVADDAYAAPRTSAALTPP